MENSAVFKLFLTIRILSVVLVQTFFVPDEYFQSLEIAHHLVFKYGHVTWEWTAGIRSYIPVLFVAGLFKILEMIRLDYPITIIYAPRVAQAIFSAFSDLCFYRWADRTDWAFFIAATSWFWFYTASRTLINTVECCLTTISLSKFPWPGKSIPDNNMFLWIAAFLFNIRPTSAAMWVPLCLFHLCIQKRSVAQVIAKRYLPIGVSSLIISIAIDSILHGSFIVTVYEFLRFNVLESVSSFYGVLPWNWYLLKGFPAVLGIYIVPYVLAYDYFIKNSSEYRSEIVMLTTMAFAMTVFSFIPHKEHRFLLPILPLAFYMISRYLTICTPKGSGREMFYMSILLIGNMLPIIYFGIFHQSGTIKVMSYLRETAKITSGDAHFLFLMPCHSTPLYSHLHMNVTMRVLECLPNLQKNEIYVDEADQFFIQPIRWLRQNYPHTGKLPSHIIMFDVFLPHVIDVLTYLGYEKVLQIPHTSIPISTRIGEEVLIFEKIDL